jgi:hypothetical protein
VSDQFFLWSRKHSKDDVCLWWRPESRGYTTDLAQAGLYSAEEAGVIERGSGGNVLAVDEATARSLAYQVVSCDALAHGRRR